MIPALVALFALYIVLVTWQMRRALSAADVAVKQREAKRLLLVVTLGLPLAIAFVFVGL